MIRFFYSLGGCKDVNLFGAGGSNLSAVPSNLTFEGLARRNKENSPPVQFVQPLGQMGKKESSLSVQTDSSAKPAMQGTIKFYYFLLYLENLK